MSSDSLEAPLGRVFLEITLFATGLLEVLECLGLGLIFRSSRSLSSVSVSINFLDLLLPTLLSLAAGLAVADFFGTTLGFDAAGFLLLFDGFFFWSGSVSSSLIGLGLALGFVTKPDFLFVTGFFLFFSADDGSFSFLLGLLMGLLCK